MHSQRRGAAYFHPWPCRLSMRASPGHPRIGATHPWKSSPQPADRALLATCAGSCCVVVDRVCSPFEIFEQGVPKHCVAKGDDSLIIVQDPGIQP